MTEETTASKTFVFIDAANLFYGGNKDALNWKVDYQKLIEYLRNRYSAGAIYYFGGLEIYGFEYDHIKNDTLPLPVLRKYFEELLKKALEFSKKYRHALLENPLKHLHTQLKRLKFYEELELLGYRLNVKPIKTYYSGDDYPRKKRNCDVDMAYQMLKEQDQFDRCIVLSGDGDFLPILKHLRSAGKEVLVLARGVRTAKEVRKFTAEKFLEFANLREFIERKEEQDVEFIPDDTVR